MKIFKFSQQGKRSNNEDSLGISNGLLTVCDGMGGHNYGERASAFVVDWMLRTFDKKSPLDKTKIQQALSHVQEDLNNLLEKEPQLEKMGTTFTGIFLTPDMWYAAHIGDSRIYLFRPSERKLWHTWDHSLVGELMRSHEITIEAGRFHPMSNRIAKAIIAQKNGNPAMASIVRIDELKPGDILLLCSDGVIEGWGDWDFVNLFEDPNMSFDQKCSKLAEQCNVKSKDNNTAIVVEIEVADAFSYGSSEELEWTSFDDVEADYRQWQADNNEDGKDVEENEDSKNAIVPVERPKAGLDDEVVSYGKRSRGSWLWILLTSILVIIAALFFMLRSAKGNEGDTPKETIKTTQPTVVDRKKPVGTSTGATSSKSASSQTIKSDARPTTPRTGNNSSVKPTQTKVNGGSAPTKTTTVNASSNRQPDNATTQEGGGAKTNTNAPAHAAANATAQSGDKPKTQSDTETKPAQDAKLTSSDGKSEPKEENKTKTEKPANEATKTTQSNQ